MMESDQSKRRKWSRQYRGREMIGGCEYLCKWEWKQGGSRYIIPFVLVHLCCLSYKDTYVPHLR